MSQWLGTQHSTDSGKSFSTSGLITNVRQLLEQPQLMLESKIRVPFTETTKQYTEIRIYKRMEGVLASQETRLVWRLLTCVSVLDDWELKGSMSFDHLNPLRHRLLQTIANAFRIRAIDESFITGKGIEEGLTTVQQCLNELLDAAKG
ncbi:hypothetical protein FRC17_000882 [Serendipita sp. 399]|nr:hypothetical protein FRC17_000882 [Serendipita sp. 399]